jgi:hypothetical protein
MQPLRYHKRTGGNLFYPYYLLKIPAFNMQSHRIRFNSNFSLKSINKNKKWFKKKGFKLGSLTPLTQLESHQ